MDGPLVPLSAFVAWPCWVAFALGLAISAAWFNLRRSPVAAACDADNAARLAALHGTIDELTRERADALDATRRRDEFLTTISHELRSPLNAILGWTQVLEPRRDLAADVQDALRVIRRNALRQRQLLDDIVDLSRAVAGALGIERRPVRLGDAIQEACEAVRPEVERKGVGLKCHAECAAIVSADPRRLQQVLWNVLSNAVRFTPPGGSIVVRTAIGAGDVAIAVTDSGMGIDPAFLPHVFEPFRQQPGVTPRDASFGLGLALVRLIVEGHGGRVTAHSEGPGRGAAFTIVLPRLAEAELAAAGAAEGGDEASATPLTGVRVLAVDDEPDWRDLLGRILSGAGAEARIAGSAAEGLRIFDEWRPDVILTDIAMPGTDGYGLLAAIRSRADGAHTIPAVAMTAHAGAHERTRTACAGFVEHLAKPIPPRDLIDSVRRFAVRSPPEERGVSPG